MLVDSNGDALVDEGALPDPRAYNLVELTSMVSAILQVLAAIHGPEIYQLVAIRAEQTERALTAHSAEIEGEPFLTERPEHDDDIFKQEPIVE